MATHEYLKSYEYHNGKLSFSGLDIGTAAAAITRDHQKDHHARLMKVDIEEWDAIIHALKENAHGMTVGVSWVSVTLSAQEVAKASEIAQQMRETLLKKEAEQLDSVKTLLPNAGSTLAEKISQEFPGDIVSQAIVLNRIQQTHAQQQCSETLPPAIAP